MFRCKTYHRKELGNINVPINATIEPITNSDNIVISTVSVKLLERRNKRHSLTIQNSGGGIAYLSFGKPAVIGSGFVLAAAGGSYFSDANYPPQGEVYLIASANTLVSFVEVYS